MNLAISPCPNDTFIYEEFVHAILEDRGRVDLLDIAELNTLARSPEGPDLIKVSCASVPGFLTNYRVLPVGGAFAEAVGPLVIRSPDLPSSAARNVGLPGPGTTAHLLWKFWRESSGIGPVREEFHRFDLLPSLCANRSLDLAVVIHESRFVYQDLGLVEEIDLGAYWDRSTGLPVPLGCLLSRRDKGPEFAESATRAVRRSLQSALERPHPLTPWISSLAQEMAQEVQEQHIRTYVTERSLDCGDAGIEALRRIWTLAEDHLGEAGASRSTREEALSELALLRERIR
ncbi:MAG: 1,4-dihydroxy-6-naphthoate synthase [Fibrobacteria bacterium]|nr:1,4-dihydroxy-6-naphthoate synthase [Fibrobacteria bacterium]